MISEAKIGTELAINLCLVGITSLFLEHLLVIVESCIYLKLAVR